MVRIYLAGHEAWTFARLPCLLRHHRVEARSILHLGAHHGEEVAIYRQCGFQRIILVEPDPDSLDILHAEYGHVDGIRIIGAAAVPTGTGSAFLHKADRTVWSGLRPHPSATGETVKVRTLPLDDLIDDANVLVLDTQGSELDLLQAADLPQLDMIIVETTRRHGEGAAFYPDALAYMISRDWQVAEEWVHDDSGFTDTVFIPQRPRV